MLDVIFFLTLVFVGIFANRFDFNTQVERHQIQNVRGKKEARVGGILIFFFIAGSSFGLQNYKILILLLLFIPTLLPAVTEDFFHRHDVFPRVLGSSLTAVLVSVFFFKEGGNAPFLWGTFTCLLVAFILVGFCFLSMHSFNLIDGMDGLASGYFCLSLIFLVNIIPAPSFGEMEGIVLTVLQATSVFFCFNFIFSRVLLGDAGAYLLGYLLFLTLVFLALSVDFQLFKLACLVGFLPLYEVTRTIVRRFFARVSVTSPDRLHLHSILFEGWSKAGMNVTMSNKLTTVTLLCFFGAYLFAIYEFQNYSITPFVATVSTILLYEGIYYRVFNFIKPAKDI